MKLMKRLENIFAAVAFAEEGEADTARDIMGKDDGHGNEKRPECVCNGDDCLTPPPVRA